MRIKNTRVSFWIMIDMSGGPDSCWTWIGKRQNKGYGAAPLIDPFLPGPAHRIAFQIHQDAPLTRWQFVLHKCDNRLCCNPAHLFIGTAAENTHDMMAKSRHPHNRKLLSAEDVRTIRHLGTDRGSQLLLADRFGITVEAIYQIVKGTSYKSVM